MNVIYGVRNIIMGINSFILSIMMRKAGLIILLEEEI